MWTLNAGVPIGRRSPRKGVLIPRRNTGALLKPDYMAALLNHGAWRESWEERVMAQTLEELRRGSQQQLCRLRAAMQFDLGSHKRTRLDKAGCGGSGSLLHNEVAEARCRC